MKNECVSVLTDNYAKQVCIFLSDYASWLLGVGATCIRIEKNIDRMARTFHVGFSLSIMPKHIHLTVCDWNTNEYYSNIKEIHNSGISFDVNTHLSQLSWQVADGKLSLDEAEREFSEIKQIRPECSWKVLILASVANMSFCRLFHGDLYAMGVVLVATLVGYFLKQQLLRKGADVRFVFLCCSFLSSLIAALSFGLELGTTPDIAVGTSVLYLVPGIPYINSVSDMIDRHYLCAFSRFVDAVILTVCLSLGLCGGMLAMGLNMF